MVSVRVHAIAFCKTFLIFLRAFFASPQFLKSKRSLLCFCFFVKIHEKFESHYNIYKPKFQSVKNKALVKFGLFLLLSQPISDSFYLKCAQHLILVTTVRMVIKKEKKKKMAVLSVQWVKDLLTGPKLMN